MNFRHSPALWSAIFLNTLCVLNAAEPVILTLTPMQVAARAVANNRDLAAARYSIRQAEARLIQAGLRPNPELELGHRKEAGRIGPRGEYGISAGFKQRFPITARLEQAKSLARVDIAIAAAEIQNRARELAGEAVGKARNLQLVSQKVATNQELQEITQKLIDTTEKRLETGEVSPADVNLARIEQQKLGLASATLLAEKSSTEAELNQLLGRNPASGLQISGNATSDFDAGAMASASRSARSRRADRQMALLQIDRAGAERALAKSEQWEDWTVGLAYSRDVAQFDSPIGSKVDNFIGITLTIPLPLFNKNQGKIAEAEANRQQAGANVNAIDLLIAAEIEAPAAEMRRLHTVLERYQTETLKLADENIALLQKGYTEGLVPITTVIQAQQQVTELRQGYLDTLAAYTMARTRWETAAALVLPPRGGKR